MADGTPDKAVLVRIRGRVQGVGFRNWVDRSARRLGLTGWVRNRRDGSVEALLAGRPEAVDDMVGRCRFGPRSAAVSGVETSPGEGSFDEFDILPTE
jgi:acylphosphatase